MKFYHSTLWVLTLFIGSSELKAINNISQVVASLKKEEKVTYTIYNPLDHREEQIVLKRKATLLDLKKKSFEIFKEVFILFEFHEAYYFNRKINFWYQGRKINKKDDTLLTNFITDPKKRLYCLTDFSKEVAEEKKVAVKDKGHNNEGLFILPIGNEGEEIKLCLLEQVVSSEKFTNPVYLTKQNDDSFSITSTASYTQSEVTTKRVKVKDIVGARERFINLNDQMTVLELLRATSLIFDVPLTKTQLVFKGKSLEIDELQSEFLKNKYPEIFSEEQTDVPLINLIIGKGYRSILFLEDISLDGTSKKIAVKNLDSFEDTTPIQLKEKIISQELFDSVKNPSSLNLFFKGRPITGRKTTLKSYQIAKESTLQVQITRPQLPKKRTKPTKKREVKRDNPPPKLKDQDQTNFYIFLAVALISSSFFIGFLSYLGKKRLKKSSGSPNEKPSSSKTARKKNSNLF